MPVARTLLLFQSTIRCFALAASLLLLPLPVRAAPELASGPMVGHVGMREALVWAQTDEAATLRIEYAPVDGGDSYLSTPVATDPMTGHTATLRLDKVEPGRQYRYAVEVNGAKVAGANGTFTTPPNYYERFEPPAVRVAVVGSHYVTEEGFEPPYRTLGGGYGIFETVAKANPDLVLWAGNTAHLRESDWSSQSGYWKRYHHSRSVPELKSLLANVPQYAVWANRDFGPPEAGRYASQLPVALETFRAFWPSPSRGVPGCDGLTANFRIADVEFFLLDVQSFRDTLVTGTHNSEILGDAQLQWLRRALAHSTATFKVIVAGNPILNPADNPANLSSAQQEHNEFLRILRSEQVNGLFFISGGKPFGELTRLVQSTSYELHDLTVGPVTASPNDNRAELNYFRMPGTSSFERHFALLEFKGPEDARVLEITVLDADGQEFWKKTLEASAMRHISD